MDVSSFLEHAETAKVSTTVKIRIRNTGFILEVGSRRRVARGFRKTGDWI